MTPLTLAVKHNHLEIVKLLLEKENAVKIVSMLEFLNFGYLDIDNLQRYEHFVSIIFAESNFIPSDRMPGGIYRSGLIAVAERS